MRSWLIIVEYSSRIVTISKYCTPAKFQQILNITFFSKRSCRIYGLEIHCVFLLGLTKKIQFLLQVTILGQKQHSVGFWRIVINISTNRWIYTSVSSPLDRLHVKSICWKYRLIVCREDPNVMFVTWGCSSNVPRSSWWSTTDGLPGFKVLGPMWSWSSIDYFISF